MRGIEEQVFMRSREDESRFGPGYRVEKVILSPEAYAALRSEVTRYHAYTGPAQQGIRSMFHYLPDRNVRGDTAILLNRNGTVIGAMELDLPPDVLRGGSFYSSKATAMGMDMASAVDYAAMTINAPLISKKTISITTKSSTVPAGILGSSQSLSHLDAKFQKWYDQWLRQVFGQPEPKQERRDPLPVRKQAEGVIAYRKWNLEDDYRLRSLTADQAWDGPVLRADAPPTDRKPSPSERVPGHGIYAWKNASDAQPEWDTYGDLEIHVAGKVELRGRVVAHRHGYRAELARILELRLATPPKPFQYDSALIPALEERYQCDVRIGPWT